MKLRQGLKREEIGCLKPNVNMESVIFIKPNLELWESRYIEHFFISTALVRLASLSFGVQIDDSI